MGPPGSGNGGYTAGLLAGALGHGMGREAVRVTLRQPPPVERALWIDTGAADDGTGAAAALYDGDQLLADAQTTTLDGAGPRPDPIGWDDAQAAAAGFDLDDYADRHPFPRCFACGPARDPGDGLRLFPAAVAPGLVAWPWRPDESSLAGDGSVAPEMVWAALDCPSGLCWFHEQPPVGPHVLGRMTAALHRLPEAGEPLVVGGWLVEVAGRKRMTGSVVWSTGGEVVAENRATWIGLDERQLARFGTAGR